MYHKLRQVPCYTWNCISCKSMHDDALTGSCVFCSSFSHSSPPNTKSRFAINVRHNTAWRERIPSLWAKRNIKVLWSAPTYMPMPVAYAKREVATQFDAIEWRYGRPILKPLCSVNPLPMDARSFITHILKILYKTHAINKTNISCVYFTEISIFN